MADPILTVIDPNTFTEQEYSVEDIELVSSQEIESPFNTNLDSVELYWYDTNQQLIASNTNYTSWKSYQDSSIPTTGQLQALYLDPIIDGQAAGISNGDVFLVYNFVSNKLTSSDNNRFYISSISADRTEVSLKSNNISDETLIAEVAEFKADLETGQYFEDFYLNFGDNDRLIGLNIRTIDVEGETEVQVKLYDPLPNQYQEKTTLWIQIDVAGSTGYKVTYDEEIILPDTTQRLRGPNLNINPTSGNSSEYQSSDSLRTANLTGSVSQLKNLLGKYQVKLNIDYTDYSNFVHFSSATQRLENFHYKASLIESYQNDIDAITGSTAPTLQQSQSIASLQGEIDRIISNFDGYDYYLYYESGSKAWPKTNSTKPYSLASTGSAAVISWYGTPGVDGTGQLQSASLYDNENQDNLIYSIPEFIREDSANTGYELFIEMIGQHFDNLYLYTEAITQKYNADNRLDYGVSKDLVADTLRSFGVKLYENNFSTDDLYTALIGLTPEGSTLPLPSISTTFPVTGSGLEYIETIISASNEVIPLDDLNKSIYKRLYHNLPALVKKKGTLAGIKLLVNTYGISDTILRINEFGGKDKNSNTWDYWQNEYDYAFDTQGTNFITSSFNVNTAWGASDDVPGAVAFRFKTSGIPSESNYSQSLWSTDGNNALRLRYVGTADTSGSYSGSIVNPYNKYGRLEFFPDSTDLNSSASLYLPLFDGGWWSVLVNKNSDSSFTVYSGNSIYNGTDGNTLGFTAADSVTKIGNWSGSIESYFGSSSLDATLFSGSLQEIRYYKNPISQSVFNDFIMNPDSIEGNGLNSSPDQLIFRAALGSELYTGSVSIHPKVSGEWTTTASFTSDSNFYFDSTPVYQTNTGIGFYDQPAVGIKNAVSNKIRLEDSTLYGTTLSGLTSLQQNYPASESYTRNVNYLEVGYSPQNEINEDIMDSIGYFNIGDYIGDPRQISSTDLVYPDLEELKKDYFKKYSKSYNYQDYFRIIKFYDNSLFKMIKDFIPARTAAATGAIVKQHLLERNRQRPAQLSWTRPEYSASIQPQSRGYETGSIEVFTGGTGGSLIVPQGGTETVFSSGSLIFATGLYSYFYNLLNNATNEPYTYTISFDVPSGYSDGSLMLFDATGIVFTPSSAPVLFSASMADITGTSQKFTVEVQNGVAISYFFDSISYLDLEKLKVTHELYDPAQGFPTSSINGLLGPVNIPFFNTTPYYQGDFPGTTVDVVNNKLQDNPLLGETYKYSIADLQDIDVTVSQDLLIDNFAFNTTASIPFDTDALNSPKYNTTTFTYIPEFSNIVDYSLTLQGTYSCSLAGPLGEQSLIADLSINGATGSYPVTLFTVDNTGPTSDFTGSFTQSILVSQDSLLELGEFKVVIYEGNPGTAPFFPLTASFQDSRWTVLTENLAAQSTYYLDPTVFTQQNFPGNINEFSEYNSLLNNVYSNRVSNKYFNVDYTNGVLNPSNFGPIISQSALYAQIQDSNYDPRSVFFETRYGGTKYTGTLNTTESIKQNSTPPNIPVDRFTNYFAVSDRIDQYTPISNQSNIHLVQLVGPSGDIIPLNSNDTTVIGLLQQIYPNSTAGSLLDVGLNTTITGSLQNIPISGSGVFRAGGLTFPDGANIVTNTPTLTRNSLTLIIPQNYNPNLNPVSIAKGAGII